MATTNTIFKNLTRGATACTFALALLGAYASANAASGQSHPETSSMTPAAQTAAGASLLIQAPTLTSIHQVEYTDQGVETWIQVKGTGHCSFTIEGAGVAPQSFTNTAAKPFPMKVKIVGAPLGSHKWTAKGTGKCTGVVNTTFAVNG